jgi:hypothetical protein
MIECTVPICLNVDKQCVYRVGYAQHTEERYCKDFLRRRTAHFVDDEIEHCKQSSAYEVDKLCCLLQVLKGMLKSQRVIFRRIQGSSPCIKLKNSLVASGRSLSLTL